MAGDGPGSGVEQLVGAFFGLLFVVLNSGLLGTAGRVVVSVLALGAVAVVVAAYLRARRGTGSAGMFAMTRSYRVIVAVEVVALVAGIAVLGRVAPYLTVPWVVLVVGAHFLAFARWWPDGAGAFLLLGLVMIVLGVAGGALGIVGGPDSELVVQFVAGFLTGVVMLAGGTSHAVRRLRA